MVRVPEQVGFIFSFSFLFPITNNVQVSDVGFTCIVSYLRDLIDDNSNCRDSAAKLTIGVLSVGTSGRKKGETTRSPDIQYTTAKAKGRN